VGRGADLLAHGDDDMTETLGRLARASLVTTTLLAIALTVLLANATSANVRISIAVGLLGTVLAMLISLSADLHAKLDKIERELHAKHDAVAEKLHEKQDAVARVAAAPIQRVLDMPHLEPTILGIIESAARAQDRSQLMSDLMTEAVMQASQRIDAVGAGCFQCERDEELRFVKRVLKRTTRVRAIAYRGVEWYAQPVSKAYFDAYGDNQDAVRVTRVFVVKPNEWSRMDGVLAEEKRRGVEVHCVLSTDVPESCREGIVLFDDVLLHRQVPEDPEIKRPRTVQFVDYKQDIDKAITSFETVLKAALDKER
jgi:hypothetical protein